jgi:hypothetical protein
LELGAWSGVEGRSEFMARRKHKVSGAGKLNLFPDAERFVSGMPW